MSDWLDPAILPAGIPLVGALVLAMLRSSSLGSWIAILASGLGLAAATMLPWQMHASLFILVDPLSAHITLLTAFIGFTTAIYSRRYIAVELIAERLSEDRAQQYNALFMGFLGFMLLAVLSNNLGVTWVAIEAATISAVLVVGLPRSANAIEASWKFFLLCGVGIGLALFGTVVLYLAALPALGPGYAAMTWTELLRAAPNCRATLLNLAFVFMLIGYGTKAGLAPLHGWMPDAHAEGPTPVSAVLSGSILNVALMVIIRLRAVMAANAQAIDPGPPIMALGLLSVLFAAFSLWGRRDVKRFFAFSTIEQSGLAALAIGLGGVGAMFAALLHITVHTLAKSAVFQAVGRAAQRKGAQSFTAITGLIGSDRALGLALATGIIAIAGMPPFGLFASEILILSETIRLQPWLLPWLAIGLIVSFWQLGARLISLCLGAPTDSPGPAVHWTELLPAWVHLAAALVLGVAMPISVAGWLLSAAQTAIGAKP